ncbi:MAG: hypothetical protein IPN67_17075 [Bacteroidales bacterium]|nr:hypothetical protein [Bacteroidales bacterium]
MNVQVAMPAQGMLDYVKDVAAVIDGVREISSVSRYNGVNRSWSVVEEAGRCNAVEVSRLVHLKLNK